MIFIIVIISILFVIQIIFNLQYLLSKISIEKRFNIPLGEQVEAATVLENYVKIYRNVNLKVDANIKFPARALNNFILVNKKKMYLFDLFTTYFLVFELELTNPLNRISIRIGKLLSFLFLNEIILFFLGIYFHTQESNLGGSFFSILLGLQIITIGLSFVNYLNYEFVLNRVHDIALDLLNLDELEEEYAIKLQNELKLRAFNYPLKIFNSIWQFLKPF